MTSPRVAPGVLSRQAWQALDAARHIVARSLDDPLPLVLTDGGLSLFELVAPVSDTARDLVERADGGPVVWVGSPDADPGLTDALAQQLAAHDDPPELELLIGSWDEPGSRLLDAVSVMDRLRSPGGCPWDAQQTHESLTPYLIEEAYECVEALESGTWDDRVEELGDVLLQVLFHARVGHEGDEPFDIDDVAASLVDKLIRRHPHVFAGGPADTAEDVRSSWEEIKAEEKPDRAHPLDGIPAGMPDLVRAGKVVSRLTRAGHLSWLQAQLQQTDRAGVAGAVEQDAREPGTLKQNAAEPGAPEPGTPEPGIQEQNPPEPYGVRQTERHASILLGQVIAAQQDGVDAASALRGLLRRIESASRDRAR
ncbi:MAG: MazG family protein [Ornithinimicrobium sp.]